MKYYCSNCGAEFLRWEGRCSACGQWGTLVEIQEDKSSSKKGKNKSKGEITSSVSLSDYIAKNNKEERFDSGYKEVDRVLGGGIVKGSVVLLAGEPGIGKSTLLLQIVLKLAENNKILYVAGEESISQLYSRVLRLNKSDVYSNPNLKITENTNVEELSDMVVEEKPDLIVVDSIQSIVSDSVRSSAGSIGQVRVGGSMLTRLAKELNIPIFIVGQINKEGNIAGPKVLEHVVDVVLYFEGGEYNVFRLLRSSKNRFGATNEIGIFEMLPYGFEEVSNPSKVFLDSVEVGPGSAVGCILKGSRVVFVEVQALVVERNAEAGPLRRVANGIKKPRLDMLCAVLSKRGGVFLGDKDVFVNVVGGLTVDDPSLDLAVCAAIKAAVSDIKLSRSDVYFGEVGLTGEIRSGWGVEQVIKESSRVGYEKVVTGGEKLKKAPKIVVQSLKRVSQL